MAQPKRTETARKRSVMPLVLGVLVAGALVLAVQQTLAAQVGSVIAGALISTVGAVMGLLGSLFGAA